MTHTIAVRGANGFTAFIRIQHARNSGTWRCVRDNFDVIAPALPADTVGFLQALVAHAQTHTGTIAQIVELSL